MIVAALSLLIGLFIWKLIDLEDKVKKLDTRVEELLDEVEKTLC